MRRPGTPWTTCSPARPLESAVEAPFAWQEGWEYLLAGRPPVLDDARRPRRARRSSTSWSRRYRAAFTAPGYDETEEQVQRFATDSLPAARHAGRPSGWSLVREAGAVRGFGYGFTGEHGMWWTERLTETAPADSRPLLDAWLGGHFEVVAPRRRPGGTGPRLRTLAPGRGLLLDLPHERALLSTYAADRPAPRLYARLGWQPLVRGVLDGDSDVWGLDLRRAR